MKFKHKTLDLNIPRLMGILNVTPDSFSDGGSFAVFDKALQHAEAMLANGADFIDVGGESTRPGAADVSLQQELDRVIPIIEALTSRFDTVISIDTSKAVVMTEAVAAGAGLINDVRALREEEALQAAVNAGVPVCLMHMQGQPRSMQQAPKYTDVMVEVSGFLQQRVEACLTAGIEQQQIIVDPGFGFGKSMAHNYRLLNNLQQLHELNLPILVGLSRKSMFGALLKREVDDRLAASLAGVVIALQKGVHIIRVHDVKETKDAMKVVSMLNA